MDNNQKDPPIPVKDDAIAFFREAASRKAERPTAPPFYARKVAVVMGALLGLTYGLATQFCNSLVAPSIPYTHYPFGIVGNIAASVIGFTLISWVCSVPTDFTRGALYAALTAVIILELRALFIGMPLSAMLASPFAWFSGLGLLMEIVLGIPAMLIYRWSIDTQADSYGRPIWSWPRLALPLVFLAAAVGLGFFSLYPQEVHAAMLDTNALITRGLTTSNAAGLPAALRNENGVQDFIYYAARPYTLELGDYAVTPEDPLNGTQPGYAITIIARFKGGWAISCVYQDRLQDPVCKSYGPANAPPTTDFRATTADRLD